VPVETAGTGVAATGCLSTIHQLIPVLSCFPLIEFDLKFLQNSRTPVPNAYACPKFLSTGLLRRRSGPRDSSAPTRESRRCGYPTECLLPESLLSEHQEQALLSLNESDAGFLTPIECAHGPHSVYYTATESDHPHRCWCCLRLLPLVEAAPTGWRSLREQ